MQKAEQYRQFAESLTAAAQEADEPTRRLLLGLARAWQVLAEEADDAEPRAANVIEFPGARSGRPSKPSAMIG